MSGLESYESMTLEEYGCLEDFAVLFSGGLDSTAVPLVIGPLTRGGIHLLTFKHRYGALVNDWSRRHIPELQRELDNRVEHHVVDHTHIWNALGIRRFWRDMVQFRGHFVVCLGCQTAMATYTMAYCLERNITNAFICSSVGGEYAVMSMAVTRQKKQSIYRRFGIRYAAPLLDLGMRKDEERRVLAEHDMEPGWGRRRSHNGYQPICLLGMQHATDIVFDFHTTYDPQRVAAYLDAKFPVMEELIHRQLQERGLDPQACIERNLEKYEREEQALREVRAPIPSPPGS